MAAHASDEALAVFEATVSALFEVRTRIARWDFRRDNANPAARPSSKPWWPPGGKCAQIERRIIRAHGQSPIQALGGTGE
jgi:hypothetical protein